MDHFNWSNYHHYRFDNRIEIIRNSDNTVVDTYGKDTNVSGDDPAYGWVTPSGYFKRKDNRYANTEFYESDWVICPQALDWTNATSTKPYPVDSLVLPATSSIHRN